MQNIFNIVFPAAIHTIISVCVAVQFHHLAAAGFLVKVVYILRYDGKKLIVFSHDATFYVQYWAGHWDRAYDFYNNHKSLRYY